MSRRLEEYIFYPAPKITVALLRGSLADEAGNISFERVAWMVPMGGAGGDYEKWGEHGKMHGKMLGDDDLAWNFTG